MRVPSPSQAESRPRGAKLVRADPPVTWTAVCPHGRDMDWTAVLVDTRAVITCRDMCPEEAA